MPSPQPGILAPIPSHSRYLEFGAVPGGDVAAALRRLGAQAIDGDMVVGLGAGLVQGLGRSVEGLRAFPAMSGPGCEVPSTQADLWCWLRGADRGRIVNRGRALRRLLAPALRCDRVIDAFKYDRGLDLSGYEDGTENPKGDAAVEAAIARGLGASLDGSSFVAVQQWLHDLDRFQGFSQDEQDNVIGRRLSDNEELDDAPEAAHVKRAAQESFDPEAFVVRRSMPWADARGEGIVFVAFGKSFDAFEAILGRMTGQEDGVIDRLFRFTRPLSGSFFWCPPLVDGRLELAALEL